MPGEEAEHGRARLCEANDDSLFERYLADGMKAEVETSHPLIT